MAAVNLSPYDWRLSAFILAASIIAVTLLWQSARYHARFSRGECAQCGYPRGAAMRCSECGHPVLTPGGPLSGVYRPEGEARRLHGDEE